MFHSSEKIETVFKTGKKGFVRVFSVFKLLAGFTFYEGRC